MLTGLCPGNYQVIVTEQAGCVAQTSFVVGEPAPIVLSASPISAVSCAGGNDGSATASASGGAGGIVFWWDAPNFPTGPNVFGLEAGEIDGSTARAQTVSTVPFDAHRLDRRAIAAHDHARVARFANHDVGQQAQIVGPCRPDALAEAGDHPGGGADTADDRCTFDPTVEDSHPRADPTAAELLSV